MPGTAFLALLKAAGFVRVEAAGATGFKSSPVTEGMLFRAVKPA